MWLSTAAAITAGRPSLASHERTDTNPGQGTAASFEDVHPPTARAAADRSIQED